jgi:hypothetical protein
MDLDLERAITMQVPCLIKARPDGRSGRRIVEVEVSTEEVDLDGDIVLQSALLNAGSKFCSTGHLDIDHFSEIGYQVGILDPASYIVGRPLDVISLAGNCTSVVGEISKALGPPNGRPHQSDIFWESLRREPPVVWYSSIFGYPTAWEDCAGNDGACGCMGATRFVIKAIDWRSLAFTRSPKNTALKGAARIVMAKSMIADMLNKAVSDGSPHRPVQVLAPHHVAVAAERVGKPTPAQAASGNYAHGHVVVGGLDMAIENPMGSVRRGVTPTGQEWATRMPADYGRIKKTNGADGDQVDVYLGMHPHRAAELPVWIVDQLCLDAGGQFDEHKCMVGFENVSAARQAYHDGFSDRRGPDRVGAVTRLNFDEFKQWIATGDTTRPLTYREPFIEKAEIVEKEPPVVEQLNTMDAVWKARTCTSCNVHEMPSLSGYRQHFTKCLGCEPGTADVAAHALMHKQNMSRT